MDTLESSSKETAPATKSRSENTRDHLTPKNSSSIEKFPKLTNPIIFKAADMPSKASDSPGVNRNAKTGQNESKFKVRNLNRLSASNQSADWSGPRLSVKSSSARKFKSSMANRNSMTESPSPTKTTRSVWTRESYNRLTNTSQNRPAHVEKHETIASPAHIKPHIASREKPSSSRSPVPKSAPSTVKTKAGAAMTKTIACPHGTDETTDGIKPPPSTPQLQTDLLQQRLKEKDNTIAKDETLLEMFHKLKIANCQTEWAEVQLKSAQEQLKLDEDHRLKLEARLEEAQGKLQERTGEDRLWQIQMADDIGELEQKVRAYETDHMQLSKECARKTEVINDLMNDALKLRSEQQECLRLSGGIDALYKRERDLIEKHETQHSRIQELERILNGSQQPPGIQSDYVAELGERVHLLAQLMDLREMSSNKMLLITSEGLPAAISKAMSSLFNNYAIICKAHMSETMSAFPKIIDILEYTRTILVKLQDIGHQNTDLTVRAHTEELVQALQLMKIVDRNLARYQLSAKIGHSSQRSRDNDETDLESIIVAPSSSSPKGSRMSQAYDVGAGASIETFHHGERKRGGYTELLPHFFAEKSTGKTPENKTSPSEVSDPDAWKLDSPSAAPDRTSDDIFKSAGKKRGEISKDSDCFDLDEYSEDEEEDGVEGITGGGISGIAHGLKTVHFPKEFDEDLIREVASKGWDLRIASSMVQRGICTWEDVVERMRGQGDVNFWERIGNFDAEAKRAEVYRKTNLEHDGIQDSRDKDEAWRQGSSFPVPSEQVGEIAEPSHDGSDDGSDDDFIYRMVCVGVDVSKVDRMAENGHCAWQDWRLYVERREEKSKNDSGLDDGKIDELIRPNEAGSCRAVVDDGRVDAAGPSRYAVSDPGPLSSSLSPSDESSADSDSDSEEA